MIRKPPLIIGNWKMNGLMDDLVEISRIADIARGQSAATVAICPPFTLIAAAARDNPGFAIGGQDCHQAEKGAHTGCTSAAMLRDAGAELVIVGHSERRADQGEDNALVRAKAEAGLAAGLKVIVCVGETEADRDAGKAEAVVSAQLRGSLPNNDTDNIIVAYEPVWAVGTGRAATIADIDAMHGMILALLITHYGPEGADIPILYGGSVKPDNAAEILSRPDVGGALVGGASLKAEDFGAIIAAAG